MSIFIRILSKFYKSYWQYKCKNRTLIIGWHVKLRGIEHIEFSNNITIGRFSWIDAIEQFYSYVYHPKLIIGKNVKMSEFVHIACASAITIHDDVLIGSKCLITDHHHGNYRLDKSCPHRLQPLVTRGVVISKNVFLGDNVVVLPGVTIGCNTIIGANSVVTHNIPENVIAFGNPAKIYRSLLNE